MLFFSIQKSRIIFLTVCLENLRLPFNKYAIFIQQMFNVMKVFRDFVIILFSGSHISFPHFIILSVLLLYNHNINMKKCTLIKINTNILKRQQGYGEQCLALFTSFKTRFFDYCAVLLLQKLSKQYVKMMIVFLSLYVFVLIM